MFFTLKHPQWSLLRCRHPANKTYPQLCPTRQYPRLPSILQAGNWISPSADNQAQTGYVNVYVPKSLISDASNLKVFLDGNAISFNAESLTDSWFISFTYSHSTHEVTLKMNASPSITVSENQLEQWLPYGIIIVLIVIIAFLLISKKRKQQSYPVKEAKRER